MTAVNAERHDEKTVEFAYDSRIYYYSTMKKSAYIMILVVVSIIILSFFGQVAIGHCPVP